MNIEHKYIARDNTEFNNRYEYHNYEKLIYDLVQLSDRDDKYPKIESCNMIKKYIIELLIRKMSNNDNLLSIIEDNNIKGIQLRKIFNNFK